MRPDRRRMLAGAAAVLPSVWTTGARAADPAAPSAAEAVSRECALAANEGKGVLVEFYASWCVWCEPMDQWLHDASFTSILAPRFRTLRMRVWERRGAERARQLAGADDVFAQYAPAGSGLPFLAFLDGAGRTLISSISPATNENIG